MKEIIIYLLFSETEIFATVREIATRFVTLKKYKKISNLKEFYIFAAS